MGYHVKVDELHAIQESIRSQIEMWRSQMQQVRMALGAVGNTKAISGETGDNIRSYITEIHTPLMQAIMQMLEEYEMRVALYVDGYSGIDDSASAELSQDRLENQQQLLQNELNQFQTVSGEISRILSSVSDIVNVTVPQTELINTCFTAMGTKVVELNTNTGEYEESHKMDSQPVDEMLDTMQSIISARCGVGVMASNYSPGSYIMNPIYSTLASQMSISAEYASNNKAEYQNVLQNEMRLQNEKLRNKVLEKIEETGTVTEKELKEIEAYLKKNPKIDKQSTEDYLKMIQVGLIEVSGISATGLEIIVDTLEHVHFEQGRWLVSEANKALAQSNNITNYVDDLANATSELHVAENIKYYGKAMPVIGTAIDFGTQVLTGEDAMHAAVKTGAHVGIGAGATAIATLALGVTPVGWAAVGIAVGVFAVNKIFDWTYDEYLRDGVDDIVDKVEEFAENVGDAVFDFFSGTAFA